MDFLFNQEFLSELLKLVEVFPRLRVNYDLLNFSVDTSKRMQNVLAVGTQVPAGAWHSIQVIEPAVIFEAKDGAYKG